MDLSKEIDGDFVAFESGKQANNDETKQKRFFLLVGIDE